MSLNSYFKKTSILRNTSSVIIVNNTRWLVYILWSIIFQRWSQSKNVGTEKAFGNLQWIGYSNTKINKFGQSMNGIKIFQNDNCKRIFIAIPYHGYIRRYEYLRMTIA